MLNWLRNSLRYSQLSEISLDDPRSTALRWEYIRNNSLLSSIYAYWYKQIKDAMPDLEGPVVEIGAGAGFLHEYVPGLITTEYLPLPFVDIVMDAQNLPIKDASLRGILMVDVLHHLPHPRSFFANIERTLKPGGRCIMIEPWVTPWSRWVYSRLHYEYFNTDNEEWDFLGSGPLTDANIANPWKIFKRDIKVFKNEFPELHLEQIFLLTPFLYLLSGGVTMKNAIPSRLSPMLLKIENAMHPIYPLTAMFALIVLEKR